MTIKRSTQYVSMMSAILLLLTTAAVPGRQGELTADQQSIESLTLQRVGTKDPYIMGMAIDGLFAMSLWSDGYNGAGDTLLSKASGSWKVVVSSGGAFSAQRNSRAIMTSILQRLSF